VNIVHMPKVFTSKSQKIGEIGEHVAVHYLQNHDYTIIERNYTKKWGEIDIVASKGGVIHFIEVKSKLADLKKARNYVDVYKPEDGMHPWKIKRLIRTIQTYLLERRVKGDWQFDLIVLYLDNNARKAKVEFMENIIL